MELRPFFVIELEQKEAFFDFHVLNYPIFSRFYIDDAGGEPLFEDGNEDTQDELANGQYDHKNANRVTWESKYTIFKLDLYFFIQRWQAKFFMEKFAMEYYLYKLGSLFVKLFFNLIALFNKLKEYFLNL